MLSLAPFAPVLSLMLAAPGAPPPDQFTISLEEVVADGMPGPGAGNLEEAGAVDEYTFTAPAGTMIFAEELDGSCAIDWICTDANGDPVFSDPAICSNHPGVVELTLGGTYTVSVFSPNDSTGTYSFILWELNPPQAFAISLEELVADGLPGAGAGNLEEPERRTSTPSPPAPEIACSSMSSTAPARFAGVSKTRPGRRSSTTRPCVPLIPASMSSPWLGPTPSSSTARGLPPGPTRSRPGSFRLMTPSLWG